MMVRGNSLSDYVRVASRLRVPYTDFGLLSSGLGLYPLCFYVSNLFEDHSLIQSTIQIFRIIGENSALQFSKIKMGWKAAEKLIRHWKILRGDNVMIIRGKDKGETGIIKRVVRSQNRVIVEGKNLVKKHIKQGPGHEGGIFTVEAPLHASNVQVLDPVTGKPCKVGVKYLEDGTKVRVSRGIGASGSIIPRPEILKIRTTPRPTVGRAHCLYEFEIQLIVYNNKVVIG
ncbi:hypothetical protein Godav_028956 [Gossypium davidsonii]|uniref:KOW domain-containing protein n=1 Tax=Gossypium davidsonii TaxID=34287 RepID=A0A7J8T7D6_GOSDV|nr:hypothetical protein [Gossypium davidsonii]